jgi:hypothetical protein
MKKVMIAVAMLLVGFSVSAHDESEFSWKVDEAFTANYVDLDYVNDPEVNGYWEEEIDEYAEVNGYWG